MHKLVLALILACPFLGLSGPAQATDPQAVVLTVKKKNGAQIDMTLGEIEAMPVQTYRTKTAWHDGVVAFEGVPMRALLEKAGLKGAIVQVEALNGYRANFPVADAREKPVIMAYKRDGQYMSVRDKGPLFIVYDYDSNADLHSERYYARSVWQVRALVED